jgi:hypothetical protein
MKAPPPPPTSEQPTAGALPVFVFPTSLNFYTDDPSSHKQVLTLYNPYEFTVLFKVLCNNPSKYNVVEPEGLINSKCCIDIVIRVTELQSLSEREDKFRIHIYELGCPKLLGKKDVVALLNEKSNDRTKSAAKQAIGKDVDDFMRQHRRESTALTSQRAQPSVTVIVLILTLTLGLMLPADQGGVPEVGWLRLFYLTLNHKLCLAFVLGLLTMAVLKP